jgi:hypothetical protein
MKLPSDPTTWDNIARICRNADEYLERHYSDEEPEAPKKKRYKGTGHVNSKFDCADIHHRIVGGK